MKIFWFERNAEVRKGNYELRAVLAPNEEDAWAELKKELAEDREDALPDTNTLLEFGIIRETNLDNTGEIASIIVECVFEYEVYTDLPTRPHDHSGIQSFNRLRNPGVVSPRQVNPDLN